VRIIFILNRLFHISGSPHDVVSICLVTYKEVCIVAIIHQCCNTHHGEGQPRPYLTHWGLKKDIKDQTVCRELVPCPSTAVFIAHIENISMSFLLSEFDGPRIQCQQWHLMAGYLYHLCALLVVRGIMYKLALFCLAATYACNSFSHPLPPMILGLRLSIAVTSYLLFSTWLGANSQEWFSPGQLSVRA